MGAGPRSLDRGIEGEQIGLPGDGFDQLDDIPDLTGVLGQPADPASTGLSR